MPSTSGVRVPKAIVIVVIVEAKAKIIRQTINMGFRFNFSPPFLFFYPRIMICGDRKEKSYMVLDHRSTFYSGR